MSEYIQIKKEDLSVGTKVAIRRAVQFGWTFVNGVERIYFFEISRITPKRTKVIMTDGSEFETKSTAFYYPTVTMNEENRKANALLISKKISSELYSKNANLLVKSGEKMIEAAKHLIAAADIFELYDHEEIKRMLYSVDGSGDYREE